MSVLVVVQSANGVLSRISWEALAAGFELAQSLEVALEAAVLGCEVASVAGQVAGSGVSRVYLLDHSLLRDYTPEGYTLALEQLIRSRSPSMVVFPHSYQVRDYAPKLAARFGSSLISDVIAIKAEANDVYFVRQLFLGKLRADVCGEGRPTFVSVQAGAFRPRTADHGVVGASATMEVLKLAISAEQIVSKPEVPRRELEGSADLSAVPRIVAVGRGIKQKEDLGMVEALARELGAELAASRPICDNGWMPMDRLVGTSGQTVAPDLYFAIGISGAIQHVLGMKAAKTVVAINKDASAPIFDSAHYGIAGDLNTVVPALVDELRKTKS